MKKTVRTIAIYIFAAVLAVFCLFTVSAQSFLSARAAAYADELTGLLDKTSIENDLKELDLSGISASDGFQLIYFAEVGFSRTSSADYALYFYIYNPDKSALYQNSEYNTVNIAVKFNAEGEATEYRNMQLTYIDRTDDHSYYKFRLTDNAAMYSVASEYAELWNSRRYDIAGIQLWSYNEEQPQDNKISLTYTYSGYAKGYSSNSTEQSTLDCVVTESEVIEFDDLQHTYYRYPQSTNNYASKFAELKTVYFSIPNEVLDYYGSIYSIQAEYYEYDLQPVLILDDSSAYDALLDYVGVDLSAVSDTPYVIARLDEYVNMPGGGHYNTGWKYSKGHSLTFLGPDIRETADCEDCQKLVYLFYNADPSNYTIDREDLIDYMRNYTQAHGSGTAYGGYSDDLFNSESSGFEGATYIDITGDDLFDLEGFNTGNALMNWLWALFQGYDNPDIEDIEPIHPVTVSDLNLSDLSNELYIAPQDEADFKAYCREQMEQDRTVYMFRYKVDDYADYDTYSINTGLSGVWQASYENSLRYVTVDLGFDIISLGFQTDKGLTIVPVVSDPINVIPDLEPGDEILDNTNDGVPWLTIVLLLAVSIGGIVVTRIVKHYAKKIK